jgi:eukaryotic-like serine/threonine-protein kinase
VALVQPPAHLLAEASARARFLSAARLAASLNHPNIAALFEIVEENGRCCLAYELVAGPSLRQEMAGIRLGVRRAIELAAQIADGLAEGHARGVVHGDLRPETVVVTAKGSTKILSFGMTPWTSGGAARTRGGAADVRDDLFALSVLLYEMLTGRHPFEAGAPATAAVTLARPEVPPASALNPDVAPALDALLARAMSTDVEARQQSAAVMAAELRALGVGSAGRHAASPIAPEERRGSVGWWVAAVAAVVAVTTWWLWR